MPRTQSEEAQETTGKPAHNRHCKRVGEAWPSILRQRGSASVREDQKARSGQLLSRYADMARSGWSSVRLSREFARRNGVATVGAGL